MGFWVHGLEFRVVSSEARVEGSGFIVCLWFRGEIFYLWSFSARSSMAFARSPAQALPASFTASSHLAAAAVKANPLEGFASKKSKEIPSRSRNVLPRIQQTCQQGFHHWYSSPGEMPTYLSKFLTGLLIVSLRLVGCQPVRVVELCSLRETLLGHHELEILLQLARLLLLPFGSCLGGRGRR